MKLFVKFFHCGVVYSRPLLNRCDFIVKKPSLLLESVIPHFDTYYLQNNKNLDFLDFKKILLIISLNETKQKWTEIKSIIANMNLKRKY
jgi:hypothetical protein